MSHRITALIGLLVLNAFARLLPAQDVEFNPLGRDLPIAEMEKQLRIEVEWIEIDSATATKLLANQKPAKDTRLFSADSGPLRKALQELIDKGEATLVESAMVSARSGQRAKVESILEFIYPTEWDPAQLQHPEKDKGGKTILVPPQATAFETRNVGVTLEVDPVLGADELTIDLNLAPELVYLAGKEIWGSHRGKGVEVEVETPSFYTVKTTTQITLIAGEIYHMSTLTPRNLETGMTDPTRKILNFVKADLIASGLPATETPVP
jgi:hypothetical protein